MPPVEPNNEEKLEATDNDSNATPFQPADDVSDNTVPPTHPVTDTDVDSNEIYHDGISGVTAQNGNNDQDVITGYSKPDTNDNDDA